MGESPEHARIMGSVEPNSKGVHCEVESEGRLRQNSGLRNMNHIRHIIGISVQNNTKSKRVADKTMICKCGRYMEGKRYDLILGGLTEGNLVTTNCKKYPRAGTQPKS